MKFITFAKEISRSSVKAENTVTMTKSNKNSREASKVEIGVDMMTGAAAAMLYSDDEIRDVFSKEDAEEFIELRRQARENFAPPKSYDLGYNDEQVPMAAEDEIGYQEQ